MAARLRLRSDWLRFSAMAKSTAPTAPRLFQARSRVTSLQLAEHRYLWVWCGVVSGVVCYASHAYQMTSRTIIDMKMD